MGNMLKYMEETINKSNEKLRADFVKSLSKRLPKPLTHLEHRRSLLEVKTIQHDILIEQMRQEQAEFSNRVIKLECCSVRENLILSGMEETQEEDEIYPNISYRE